MLTELFNLLPIRFPSFAHCLFILAAFVDVLAEGVKEKIVPST
jgi:hypothetical protein